MNEDCLYLNIWTPTITPPNINIETKAVIIVVEGILVLLKQELKL